MRGFFKIGPWHSQDKPILFHPYHLQSHNHTCGISSGTVYPSTHNINLHHSSLLWDLSEGIQTNLSVSEGSDTSDPFPPILYSTTDTTHELHADPMPMHSTSENPLLPSPQLSSPSTLLPSLTVPVFPTIYPTFIHQNTTMSQPAVPPMPTHRDHGVPLFQELKFQFV